MQDLWYSLGMADVVVVGAGHNGLVAATLLARAGLTVRVFEAQAVVGGAVRTEHPFAKAPRLGSSTGAYLLGLMPPELMRLLDLELPLIRRDPHYFLPTTGNRHLTLGANREQTRAQFLSFFSERDWRAHEALQTELAELREDLAPTWLVEPLSIEDTAARFVRPKLQSAFVDLCRKPVGTYLERFDFASDLVKAMYAVTDGFSGLDGTWDTPGTGMNFLIHNMGRLPGADGTWMVVAGGMGTVTARLTALACAAGARIETSTPVRAVDLTGGTVSGVVLANGAVVRARAVVCNADPFRMLELLPRDRWPTADWGRIQGYRRDGTTLKVNLALRDLPRFRCLPAARGQHGATIHLLPDEPDVMRVLREAYAEARAGRLPAFPTIEWYIHTTVDPSLQDEAGRHSAALFVQWVPYEPAGSSWAEATESYVAQLLSICDRFAPGTSALVDDVFALPPPAIERHFGITRGHIHHVDNAFGFADRLPYATGVPGLYSCSAGCHPAGSVIGCAGYNAATKVMRDLGVRAA